jgi:Lactate dehydrogenase and related dehydrogenases
MVKKWKVLATAVTFGKKNIQPKERLEAMAGGCEVVTNPFGRPFTPAEFAQYGADADALIVGNDKVTAEVIASCPRVKVIAKHGIGYDSIDIKTANAKGIVVTNAPGTNSQEVADLAIGFMIMLGRGLYQANRDTKAGKWIKPMGASMDGKTIGIVGTGTIGRALARRAAGFHMNILGYDLVENAASKQLGMKYVPLDELLAQADYVSLHLPHTDGTRNILSADKIAKMKSGAILVNTARRQLVDFGALYQALKSGALRGYATDVYDFEPPEHIPLFDLENVLLSPHIGGTTLESNRRMGETAVDNVIAVLTGEKAPNVVSA